jgi:ribosomal protein S18 acetylase RimI-like enzyme
MQCKKAGSAVRNLTFNTNTSGLFEGILSRRELKTLSTNQQSTKFSDKQIDDLVKKHLGLIDIRLVSVAENEKNEIIGLAISTYSLSHAIQKSKGKLYPFGWYHLIKALKWRPENHVDLLFIAVRPDYQMLGVNAILFDDLISSYNQLGILWAETAPLQENSIQELDQWKLLNPTFTKRRRCYIKKI